MGSKREKYDIENNQLESSKKYFAFWVHQYYFRRRFKIIKYTILISFLLIIIIITKIHKMPYMIYYYLYYAERNNQCLKK